MGLLMGLSSVGFVQANLHLELDTQGLTPAQQAATQALISEAVTALPPTLIQRLDQSVPVRWQEGLAPSVYGQTQHNQIQLNARWRSALALEVPPPEQSDQTPRTLPQELRATLVHELAHLYDRAQLWASPEEAEHYQHCRQQARQWGVVGLPSACRGQPQRQFTLSDDPQLLELAGWPQQTGQRGAHGHENQQSIRSPDAYERTNAREFVAVNFEYFLLDPQYACRRPLLNRYFSQHFAWQPFQTKCANTYPILNAGQDFGKTPLIHVNPDQVYEVDYLFAEENQDWVSRWGHSMLRLVVCAPEHPLGPQCRLDLGQHLVLSFRAFIGDVQLSSWASLIGQYPSRLFVLPLNQVIDEYTRMELRSLRSVPLRLSRTQIRQLIERTTELHWEYDGAYYFLSNNCAVETLKLLRSATYSPSLTTLDSITPSGVLELLEAKGIARTEVLANAEQAARQGYRFESYRPRYEAMFHILQQRLGVPTASVDAWLDEEPLTRRPWIEQADLTGSAALLLLEQGAHYQQLLQARDYIKQQYMAHPDPAQQAKLIQSDATLKTLLGESGYLSRPAELLSGSGYGIPQPEEWDKLQQESQHRQQRLNRLSQQLEHSMHLLLGAQRAAQLNATETNLNLIAQRLRLLHRSQGRWQLPQNPPPDTHQSDTTGNKSSH